jgi:hypothetical protein
VPRVWQALKLSCAHPAQRSMSPKYDDVPTLSRAPDTRRSGSSSARGWPSDPKD